MTLAVLIIGLIGALMMFTGDQLLYLSKASVGKDSGKTVDSKMDYVAEVMSGLSQKRFRAGGLIGPVAAFVYCIGFYHLLLIVEPSASSVWKNVALVAFLFNCFGIICGGAFHSHFPYLGLFGQQDKKVERDIIVNYFKKLMLLTYVGEGIGFILMIIMIACGKTIIPRWCAVVTPGVLMLFKPAALKLPGFSGKVISGGWSNLISVIYYVVLIVVYLAKHFGL